jgi:GTPase SAR1 family protein
MSILKRKTKKNWLLPVCVVGLYTEERDGTGVGKSCFCSRFIRPAFDDYETVKGSLSSFLSEADFAHPVINNSHFLYYPPVRRSLYSRSHNTVSPDTVSSAAEVTFHVIEQTVFVNDATFKPFLGSENYVERATKRYLRSDGKLAFTCRDSIGAEELESTSANAIVFPSEVFRRPTGTGIKGFVCVYDPTMMGERKRSQLIIIRSLIKRIKGRVKVPVVLAISKCDILNTKQTESTSLSDVQELGKQFKIPVIFTSAAKNINVQETFLLVAKLVFRKKISGVEQASISYQAADEDQAQTSHQVEKDFGILLSSIVRSIDCTWSTLLPKLRGRTAFEQFVYMFGECKARSAFQRRVLQVAVAQCDKLWESRDNSNTARARKQDILRDILDEHEDFQ